MDYTPLFTFLEHEIGEGGVHVLRDTWWICSQEDLDISNVCEEIRKRIAEKDHFFFVKISSKDINGWLPSTSWQWFGDHNK